jgi:HAD superfamily hydrolase (TIGR01549 family)
MKTRRAILASRFRGTLPIRLVMFDAIATLFEPKQMSFEEYVRRNAEKILGRPIDISARTLERHVNTLIIRMSRRERHRLERRGRVWFRGALNSLALTQLGYACNIEQGAEISRLTYRGIRNFSVPSKKRREICRFVAALRREFPGVRVVIATNANIRNVRYLLRKHRLDRLFDSIYSAKEMGVTKAKPRYFLQILAEEGVKPSEARMVGNSGKSDLIAAMLGIVTVWLSFGKSKLTIGEVRALHGLSSRRNIIAVRSWKQAERLCS